MISIAIDVALLCLVGWSIVDNRMKARKIADLQATMHDLAPLIEQFSASVDRSEETIRGVRLAAEEGVRSIDATASSAAHRLKALQDVPRPRGSRVAGSIPMKSKKDMIGGFFQIAKAGR